MGGLWILLDVLSYMFISRNIGLSKSYGTFLNIWFLTELVSWSVRIGLSLQLSIGFGVLIVGVIIHWVITRFFERRFNNNLHQGSNFDSKMTSFMKNILILVIFINIVLHCFKGSGISFQSIQAEGF